MSQALEQFKSLRNDARVYQPASFGYFVESKSETYFVMFKRDFYKRFRQHFSGPEFEHFGYAQIMNLELLNEIVERDIDWIVFVMPDGKAYRANPRLFKKFHEKYKTDVPHLVGEVALPLNFFERIE